MWNFPTLLTLVILNTPPQVLAYQQNNAPFQVETSFIHIRHLTLVDTFQVDTSYENFDRSKSISSLEPSSWYHY